MKRYMKGLLQWMRYTPNVVQKNIERMLTEDVTSKLLERFCILCDQR
jgi:hypothetical protein